MAGSSAVRSMEWPETPGVEGGGVSSAAGELVLDGEDSELWDGLSLGARRGIFVVSGNGAAGVDLGSDRGEYIGF